MIIKKITTCLNILIFACSFFFYVLFAVLIKFDMRRSMRNLDKN